MKQWERHVPVGVRKGSEAMTALCGEKIYSQDFSFMSIAHANSAIVNGSRIEPCPECKARMLA